MFKRKEIWFAAIAIILMVLIGQTFIMHQQVKFDGDRVCSHDPLRYYLNFKTMNTDDSQTMILHEGDSLHVAWAVDKGKADFKIAMANETPIYRADKCRKGEAAEFDVLIPKTGEYTTTVSARHAKGWLNVSMD